MARPTETPQPAYLSRVDERSVIRRMWVHVAEGAALFRPTCFAYSTGPLLVQHLAIELIRLIAEFSGNEPALDLLDRTFAAKQ